MTTTVAITWILLLLSAASCTAAAFHHQQRQRSSSWTSRRGRRIALDYGAAQRTRRCLLLGAATEEIDDSGSSSYNSKPSFTSSSAATASSFDFASALAWEAHYSSAVASSSSSATSNRSRKRSPSDDDATKDRGGDSKDSPVGVAEEGIVDEWHQQIPLERIAEIVDRLLQLIRGADAKDEKNARPAILIVGCGTSRLPSVLMDKLSVPVHMVLLDSSRSCMEQVHQRYCGGSGNTNPPSDTNHTVECVCGNVLKPPSTWQRITSDPIREGTTSSTIPVRFDMVLDKGLMDVLLCGDDWDSTVPQLLKMADDSYSADGHVHYYVLVSYTLPPSTRQFLVEQREDWDWTFDVDGGPNRGRSMISIGRKMG